MDIHLNRVVTIQLTHLFLHGSVAVVLESSRIDTYAAVLRASRLALKKNLGKLNSYIVFSDDRD
ncbi:MAG: hypothetical protein ACE5HN_00955 [Nitrospiria bacterium]